MPTVFFRKSTRNFLIRNFLQGFLETTFNRHQSVLHQFIKKTINGFLPKSLHQFFERSFAKSFRKLSSDCLRLSQRFLQKNLQGTHSEIPLGILSKTLSGIRFKIFHILLLKFWKSKKILHKIFRGIVSETPFHDPEPLAGTLFLQKAARFFYKKWSYDRFGWS